MTRRDTDRAPRPGYAHGAQAGQMAELVARLGGQDAQCPGLPRALALVDDTIGVASRMASSYCIAPGVMYARRLGSYNLPSECAVCDCGKRNDAKRQHPKGEASEQG